MEGMRGLAALLVFFVHYVTLASPWLRPHSWDSTFASHLYSVGNAGVDLFFVLSGYLIYRILMTKSTPLVAYAARRLRRIYPTFLVVLAIYLVLASLSLGDRPLPRGWLPLTIYLTENVLLLPGMFSIPPIITVSWSLSYELFYYIATPVFIAVLRLRGWRSAHRFVLLVAIAAAGFALFQFDTEHMRLLMFVSGMILSEAFHDLGWRVASGSGFAAFASAVIGEAMERGNPGTVPVLAM